ncbi:MAG TPA: transcriptional regulator, partial [Acidobacteriaceae bacterium]
ETVLAARRDGLMLSEDGGNGWRPLPLPQGFSAIQAMAVAGNHAVWIGGREGLFYSEDGGGQWKTIARLPLGEISGLNYDGELHRVLVTSRSSTVIFGVDSADTQWKWWDAGWKVHEVHSRNGRLVGASLFDGVVVEPAGQEPAGPGQAP